MNYLTLGNQIPHLHTNVVLRYLDDPAPGQSIELAARMTVSDDELMADAEAVRRLLRQ